MIQTAIARAVAFENLSRELARVSMEQILAGEATPAQIAALAIALRMKGETADEIAGMAEAMRQRVSPLRTRRAPLLDTCGTGGDNAHTFNISTTVAIVTASCGVAVAKHGNRAVSSRTGSADVLETLGVGIDLTPEDAGRSLDVVGITFLFAPNYHGAMRHAAGPRRELGMGMRTVFNALGPLTNPAGAPRQLLGVYSDNLVPMLADVLRQLGSERALVVHGADGLDELSTTGWNFAIDMNAGKLNEVTIGPETVGVPVAKAADLLGGLVAENVTIARQILAGKKGPKRDIVVMNAAVALVAAGQAKNPKDGAEKAAEAIDSGAAQKKLDQFVAATK